MQLIIWFKCDFIVCYKAKFTLFAVTSSILINLAQSVILDSVELDCDFTSTFCLWSNEETTSDTQDWTLADRVSVDLFHSVPRGVEGLGDTFIYSRGIGTFLSPKRESASLVSDSISCQRDEGLLSFVLWKSAVPPQISVCTRTPPGRKGRLKCIETYSGFMGIGWLSASTRIPGSNKPFEIVLKADVSQTSDIVGVDKIKYKAKVCDSSANLRVREKSKNAQRASKEVSEKNFLNKFFNSENESDDDGDVSSSPNLDAFREFFGLTTAESRRRPLTSTLSPTSSPIDHDDGEEQFFDAVDCTIAECGFENDLCDWQIAATGADLTSVWREACDYALNEDHLTTGEIRSKAGFCFLKAEGYNEASELNLIMSRTFFLYQESILHFWYFLPADAEVVKLQVCINSFDECPWERSLPPRLLATWWRAFVKLTPGRTQIFFLLQNIQPGQTVGLDEIRLINTQNGRPAQCQVYEEIFPE